MRVNVYANQQYYIENYQPLEVFGLKYIAPAKDNSGWVLVKKNGDEIILPLGVVIEKFNEEGDEV